jgi:alkyldihydroxyacetonephosphate synthase
MTPAEPSEGTRSETTDRPSVPQRAVALAFEAFARTMFRAYVTLDVRGRERLPEGGYVVVSNHASHLDAMVILHVCGGPFRRFHLAAAGDYFFGPEMAAAAGRKPSRFGGLLRTALRLEPMPVRQLGESAERRAARQAAFANLAASCRAGDVVVFFPEGGRSPDGVMRRFRNGIDELSAQFDGPIVPMHIDGAYELWPKGRRWGRRGTVTVNIGEPIHPEPARTEVGDTAGAGARRPRLAKRLEAAVRRLAGEPTGEEQTMVQHMKWWGWGDEQVTFTHEDKPDLAPFVREKLGIDLDGPRESVLDFDDLTIAPPVVNEAFDAALAAVLRADQITSEPIERVVHAYGKSVRDLLRIRRGDLGRPPDVIVYPESEDDVVAIMETALAHGVVVIPFGGGTNISESLEPPRAERRTVVSVDMRKMDAVIEIDEVARLARVQAGVLGPRLEEQLNAKGWTFGHFPDSFTYSTLGGWIATRSSGMQSDKYGDISDITQAVRAVTPAGVLVTRAVPTKSTGPDVNQMILGSEGRLGIITEATVRVHRAPEQRKILGYLFPDWYDAITTMAEIAESEASPSVTRVADPNETLFSFATKKPGGLVDKYTSAGLKEFLRRFKHYDMDKACLGFIGFEGSEKHVKHQRKLVGEIVSRHNGICVGSGPGALYDQKKFDTPYIRDHLLDYGGVADVSETSAPWSVLPKLYDGVIEAAEKAFVELDVQGWIMCHLSHSYHSGACLYFTFAFIGSERSDVLDQYATVKRAIQQGFMDLGGTLSHHHAVGLAHASWLEEDISAPGVAMVRALFDGVDPTHQLNPGKIVD